MTIAILIVWERKSVHIVLAIVHDPSQYTLIKIKIDVIEGDKSIWVKMFLF